MKKLWVLTAILLLTGAVSAQTTIVTGGVVETATGQKDDATAVVLQNGKIAYVGSDEGAMAYHSGNVSEMQVIIKRYADENPYLESLIGGGWDVSAFDSGGPTRDIIDAVVSDRPVALQSADGHSAWVNSKGLERLGIDKAFASQYNDIALENGGSIVVDGNGEPTGYLKEAAAEMIASLRPAYTVEQCKAALKEQQQWLASLGFTSAFDAGVVNTSEGTETNMYQALSEMASDKEHYSVTTIKMMADQVLEEGTAYLSEGMYADGMLKDGDIESNNIWAGKEDMMEKVFEYAGEHGLNLHIHQIGDAAATLVLDQLEKAVAVYPNLKNQRVTFAHCQFISDNDKERMANLGVSPLVAPYWAVMDDYYWDVYLPLMSSQEKLDTQYPMQSLVQNSINVAFHSDYFVSWPIMCQLPCSMSVLSPLAAVKPGKFCTTARYSLGTVAPTTIQQEPGQYGTNKKIIPCTTLILYRV